jgi:hypothetical protein
VLIFFNLTFYILNSQIPFCIAVLIDSLAKGQLMQSQPLKPMLTQKLTLSGGDTVDMDGHITLATAIV